ncbi:MAG: hypothetical protein QM703_28965 [Gemmatales bacterium]
MSLKNRILMGILAGLLASCVTVGPKVIAKLWSSEQPSLPVCESQEIKHLLQRMVRSSNFSDQVREIDGFQELSYDPKNEERIGQCVLHTAQGEVPVKFTVNWLQKSCGMFTVTLKQ